MSSEKNHILKTSNSVGLWDPTASDDMKHTAQRLKAHTPLFFVLFCFVFESLWEAIMGGGGRSGKDMVKVKGI